MITLSGSELGIIKPIGILLLAFTLFASAGYRTLNRKLAEKYTSFERTYFMIGVSWAVRSHRSHKGKRRSVEIYSAAVPYGIPHTRNNLKRLLLGAVL